MDLVKFSDYDLFGYFVSGLVMLGVIDEVTKTKLVIGADWTQVEHTAFVIIAAYVLGHITASAAALFFDRILVRKALGTPSEILFGEPVKGHFNWKKWLLSGFFEPLPESIKAAALAQAGIAKYAKGDGEIVFWKAWPVIKRDALPYARMDAFLRLYGFCRNLSFVAFVAGVAFVFKPPAIPGMAPPAWAPAVTMFAVSLAMFHRYLKFFRLYSVEVISTYAEPAKP